jgi:hypothetical protein
MNLVSGLKCAVNSDIQPNSLQPVERKVVKFNIKFSRLLNMLDSFTFQPSNARIKPTQTNSRFFPLISLQYNLKAI